MESTVDDRARAGVLDTRAAAEPEADDRSMRWLEYLVAFAALAVVVVLALLR